MSKTLSRGVLPLLLLALLGSCQSNRIDVDTAFDAEHDFTKVKTFDWLNAPPEAQTVVRDAALLAGVERAMVARGMQRSRSRPDVLVAVHRTIEGSLHTKTSGYEFREGRFQRYQLQSGTLVVDLVEPAGKQSVWRGTASGAFRAEMTAEERITQLDELLAEMFADFPPGR